MMLFEGSQDMRSRGAGLHGKRFWSRSVLVAGITVSVLLGSAIPASAETLSPDERAAGLWYVDAMGIPSAHAEGLTGKGMRIAVVDDGINLNAAELQGANIKVHGGYCLNQDTAKPFPADSTESSVSQHGTSVVAMLVGNGRAADGGPGTLGIVPDAEIDFYAAGPVVSKEQQDAGWEKLCPTARDKDDGSFTGDAWGSAMSDAVSSGASFVSVSLAGSGLVFKEGLIDASRRGVTVVASIVNPGDDSLGVGTFPAAGNGTVAVNAIGRDNKVIGQSEGYERDIQLGSTNTAIGAPGVRILSIGSDWEPKIEHGTSYATPLVVGALALAAEKFPGATQNQLLQALINTTEKSAEQGGPSWDKELGYGIISLPNLLASDPSSRADINPLFVADPNDPRCLWPRSTQQPTSMDKCYWAQLPTAQQVKEAVTSPSSSVAPDESESSAKSSLFSSGFFVFGIGGVLILAAATVVTLLVRRRKKRQFRSDGGHELRMNGSRLPTTDGFTQPDGFTQQHFPGVPPASPSQSTKNERTDG